MKKTKSTTSMLHYRQHRFVAIAFLASFSLCCFPLCEGLQAQTMGNGFVELQPIRRNDTAPSAFSRIPISSTYTSSDYSLKTEQEQIRRIASYRMQKVRLNLDVPVMRERLQSETRYREVSTPETKVIWETERRYKVVEKQVPVERQREIVRERTVSKPVVETSYEQREVSRTEMVEETSTRQEQYVVNRPVTRTELRDETVVVQKPVTRTIYEAQDVTTYRPSTQYQTVYSPVLVPNTEREDPYPRLRFQPGGYVNDPATGREIWNRGGLRWVRENASTNAEQFRTAYMPQVQATNICIPETTRQYKPVTVQEYENAYETRRVPYEVQTTEQVIESREIPVTVRKPVTRVEVVEVPVKKLRYEDEIVREVIPVKETVMETVREEVPYDVQVRKEVTETSVKQVPYTVQKLVATESVDRVVRDVIVRVPLDENDEPAVEIPSTITISVPFRDFKAPANGEIVDIDWLKTLISSQSDEGAERTTARASLDSGKSGTDLTETSGKGINIDNVQMPESLNDNNDQAKDGKPSEGTTGEVIEGFRRSEMPGAPLKAADTVPKI